MRKSAVVSLILLLLALQVPAQMVISVDPNISRNAHRSGAWAMLLSGVVPGAGQIYLQEKSLVQAYLWTDLAFMSAAAITWFSSQTSLTSAQGYARRHSGIVNPPADPDFLDLLAQYRSRDGILGQNSNPDLKDNYNLALIRSGESPEKYYPFDAAHTWDWGSSENPQNTANMQEYNQIMRRYRMARIGFQVSIGALVLNRLVSVFDVMRIYRSTSSANFAVAPLMYEGQNGAQMVVNF